MNEMLQLRGKQTCPPYIIYQMLTVSTDIRIIIRLVPLAAASGAFILAWEKTICDATTGFPAKWCLRNEPRKSLLMTRQYRCHYPDLGSASGWLKILLASTNQKQYPDLGSDASSVWNFFTHFSDFILCRNQWRCCKMLAGFSSYPLTSLV